MVIKTRRRAINHLTRTRKQIAGARLRNLPGYISHDKYVRDNLTIYYSGESFHKKKRHHIALQEKAEVIKQLRSMGVNKQPPNFRDFRDRPEYISHSDYQDDLDSNYYYTKETYHKKINAVEVTPVLRNVRPIIDKLMEMPISERANGKYIFNICSTNEISKKDKCDAIRILLANNFSPNYIIPSIGISLLCWTIKLAKLEESSEISLLLLDAHVLFFPGEDLLLISIERGLDLLPRKILETGYTPNVAEMKKINIILRNRIPGLLSPETLGFLYFYYTAYFASLRKTAAMALSRKKPLDRYRLTGVLAPKTAFVIMGHGGELNQKRTQMPENCVLVTQAHSGEVTHSADGAFFALFNYNIKPQILDPITNYERISGAILKGRGSSPSNYSSLAVYRTGNLFPEFIYKLLAFWDSDTEEGGFIGTPNRYRIIDSGVAQYPFNGGAPRIYILDKSSTDYEPLINLFSRSIYPTSTQIRTFIEAIPNPKTIKTIVNKLLESPLIIITQSQLFAKLGSGVYYNLICRDIVATKESVLDSISRRALPLIDSAHKIRPNNRPEIFLAIGEAEGERKDLIERLHLDDDRHFDIIHIIHKLNLIDHNIASGNTDPRLPYLKYLYSKKYYNEILSYYTRILSLYQRYTPDESDLVYREKIADLHRTVATPQHLSESDLQSALHYPQRPITPEEKTRQQKQKTAHNQWVASHPNNNSDV